MAETTNTRWSKKKADDFLAAYACGATVEMAAAKAGISKSTAYRRLKDPDFQRRLDDIRAETVRRVTDMLTASNLEAAKSLLDLQKVTTSPGVRLGAARATIELSARLRENYDLAERLAALENRMNINQQKSA